MTYRIEINRANRQNGDVRSQILRCANFFVSIFHSLTRALIIMYLIIRDDINGVYMSCSLAALIPPREDITLHKFDHVIFFSAES